MVEYAPYGNLRQYLRSKRPPLCETSDQSVESSITLSNLVSYALQIAKGMQFLADHQVYKFSHHIDCSKMPVGCI